MVSVAEAMERIKSDPRGCIEPSVAEGVCRELGLEWAETELTPPVTLGLLARQVLAGNVSNPELLRAARAGVTPAAYCTAKGRLPVEAVREVARRVCGAAERWAERAGGAAWRWKGRRTWHVDGSSFSMPDTPELQAAFGQSGQQKAGCGFPVAHLLCLFDALTGFVRDVVVSPLRTADVAVASLLHPLLRAGDVLVGDTAFGSYFHLALLAAAGVFGVFPSHQKRVVSFRPHRAYNDGKKKKKGKPKEGGKPKKALPTSRWVRRLGKGDQVVEYFKPDGRPAWMTREQYDAAPASVEVREIRRRVYLAGHRPRVLTIVTTLLDAATYPADDVVALAKGRWSVETHLAELKTTMGMDVLRCRSVDGVTRELWAFLLVYNLVQVVVMAASRRQRVARDRVSFADALYWVRHAEAGDELPDLLLVPYRPERLEPRAIKRRPKEYDRLNKPRAVMRRQLKRKPRKAKKPDAPASKAA